MLSGQRHLVLVPISPGCPGTFLNAGTQPVRWYLVSRGTYMYVRTADKTYVYTCIIIMPKLFCDIFAAVVPLTTLYNTHVQA